jgi:hypothetical protein
MCDDVEALAADMKRRGIACAPVQRLGWGLLTRIPLPGGGTVGVYQPRHARPPQMTAKTGTRAPARRAPGKPAKRKRRTG